MQKNNKNSTKYIFFLVSVLGLVGVLAKLLVNFQNQPDSSSFTKIKAPNNLDQTPDNSRLLSSDLKSLEPRRILELKAPPMPNLDEIDLVSPEKMPKEETGPQIIPG